MTGDTDTGTITQDLDRQDTIVPDNVHAAVERLTDQVFPRVAGQNITLAPVTHDELELAAIAFMNVEPVDKDLTHHFANKALENASMEKVPEPQRQLTATEQFAHS